MEQVIGRMLWGLQTTWKTGKPKKGQQGRFSLGDRTATSQDREEESLTIRKIRKSVKMSQRAAVKPLFWLIHVEKVCAEALKVSSLTLNCMFHMRK